jgi:transcriptional regulator with XRE-family HTH domain
MARWLEMVEGGIATRVGKLLQSARVRALMTQQVLADRAGTSQQWVSRVERGRVDLRLADAERLFAVLGARLVVHTAGRSDEDPPDPDVLADADVADEWASILRRPDRGGGG